MKYLSLRLIFSAALAATALAYPAPVSLPNEVGAVTPQSAEIHDSGSSLHKRQNDDEEMRDDEKMEEDIPVILPSFHDNGSLQTEVAKLAAFGEELHEIIKQAFIHPNQFFNRNADTDHNAVFDLLQVLLEKLRVEADQFSATILPLTARGPGTNVWVARHAKGEAYMLGRRILSHRGFKRLYLVYGSRQTLRELNFFDETKGDYWYTLDSAIARAYGEDPCPNGKDIGRLLGCQM